MHVLFALLIHAGHANYVSIPRELVSHLVKRQAKSWLILRIIIKKVRNMLVSHRSFDCYQT